MNAATIEQLIIFLVVLLLLSRLTAWVLSGNEKAETVEWMQEQGYLPPTPVMAKRRRMEEEKKKADLRRFGGL
jgi:hypothetical protein